jgi:galactose-1-phosphate uridylyltransferase
MSDMLKLALEYGGFTSLDKVYLEGLLSTLTPEQQLAFITPPPSVINAYFAEIYQKQNPQAATAYFLDLSKALKLIQAEPSFAEREALCPPQSFG